MNQKEKKAEEQELTKAVSVLCATIRSIAHRKARRYEQEFLIRVRDMLDMEIDSNADVSKASAKYVADEVEREILKS